MQAVAALRLACVEQEEIKWQVHVAAVGQVVDVSPGSSSYRVLLSDALLQGLNLRPMGKYQLAWVDAVMASEAEVVSSTMANMSPACVYCARLS